MCVMQKLAYLSQVDVGLSAEDSETISDETILNAKHLYNEISALCDSSLTKTSSKKMALVRHITRTVLPVDYYDLYTVPSIMETQDEDSFSAFLGYELPFCWFHAPDIDAGVYIKESFKQYVPHGTTISHSIFVHPIDQSSVGDYDSGNLSVNTNTVMGVLP